MSKIHSDTAIEKAESSIPIAMALDDNYLYPTMISIISIMENKDKTTTCSFYIMHTPELEESKKSKLLSLQEKYEKCDISLINMGDKFKNARSNEHISTPSYYRLSLSGLLPHLDMIIWLDGDTLTFGDLTEMLDLDMERYHYKGFLDYSHLDFTEPFGIYNDHHICAGVMLVNLKELRKDNAVEMYDKFIAENNARLFQHDQTVINIASYKKTGILPAKYGMPNCFTEELAVKYVKDLLTPKKYSTEEFLAARENPVISHCWHKPWEGFTYSDIWWKYAEESGFLEEIKQKYGKY